MTLDLGGWGVGSGAVVLVEEVSHSRLAEVTQIIKVPASHTVKLRQPPQSVWLVTVFDKAPGAEVALPAKADATVRAGVNVGKNYGAEQTLVVRSHSTSPQSRSAAYLKFGLGGVAPADIDLAVLEVTGSSPGSKGQAIGHVYGLTNDGWQEKAVTWTGAPNLGPTIGTANKIRHNYITGVGTSADIVGHLSAGPASSTMRLNVSDFVRRQTDGEASFLIARDVRFDGDIDDQGGLTIASRQTTTATPPRLVLFLRPGAKLPGGDAGAPAGDTASPTGDMGHDRQTSDVRGDAPRADAPANHDSAVLSGEDDSGCSCRLEAEPQDSLPAIILIMVLLLVRRSEYGHHLAIGRLTRGPE